MIKYSEIRQVHLEISTLCNAECPLCPRNFRGYPYNDGYPELNFTLDNAHKIFKPDFLKQLSCILVNGNYGDIVMNPEAEDILKYFRSHNPALRIDISTNGSARSSKFWESLAELNIRVYFCLDGLEDTHHLYRQNTSWKTVIKNAKSFIAAGGDAIWKFVEFDHNQHQIEYCRQLATELGFSKFVKVDHGRNIGPVFDRNGKFSHTIGKYSETTEFEVLFHRKNTATVLLEDVIETDISNKIISCQAIKDQSIYIAANGDVSPCCWTGFYPMSFGHGEYHQATNTQIKKLMLNHNALNTSLEECIQWFNSVKDSWEITEYSKGRLLACDKNCGSVNS